jgi:endoplasmic reticulum-Golgi intermediate compartment protein 3
LKVKLMLWDAAQVRYTEERTSFLHFLTSVCAIVGGVFTVSGIIDAFIYHSGKAMKKKVDLGKNI